MSGAWMLSGAPLSVSLSGVCLCACLLSDGGMISDEGGHYLGPKIILNSISESMLCASQVTGTSIQRLYVAKKHPCGAQALHITMSIKKTLTLLICGHLAVVGACPVRSIFHILSREPVNGQNFDRRLLTTFLDSGTRPYMPVKRATSRVERAIMLLAAGTNGRRTGLWIKQLMNIETLCAAPPEALAHSPSQMPLSCPVAPTSA